MANLLPLFVSGMDFFGRDQDVLSFLCIQEFLCIFNGFALTSGEPLAKTRPLFFLLPRGSLTRSSTAPYKEEAESLVDSEFNFLLPRVPSFL